MPSSDLCQQEVVPVSSTVLMLLTYPSFTLAANADDRKVTVNLDITNAFLTLCARLVLDVLARNASRDYSKYLLRLVIKCSTSMSISQFCKESSVLHHQSNVPVNPQICSNQNEFVSCLGGRSRS